MTFNDIFKSSFLENVSSVNIFDMVLSMILAFGISIFIFMVYKKTFKGVMYSASFGITLIALTMVSTFVILAVTSNVVLSLGMVGALSIVRFRTAIKEPLDIAFLFWSIAVGIVLAAGMIPLAVFGSICIGVVLLIFANRNTHDNPYIIVVSCVNQDVENSAKDFIKNNTEKAVIKSKTVTAASVELNYEIRLKSDDTRFVNELSSKPGINNVVLVSYNGDYMG